MSAADGNPNPAPAGGRFATTHWSLVLAARDRAAPQAREALAALCRTYWYPIYMFVRRKGYTSHETEDLTQEFFARLINSRDLEAVRREKGAFPRQ